MCVVFDDVAPGCAARARTACNGSGWGGGSFRASAEKALLVSLSFQKKYCRVGTLRILHLNPVRGALSLINTINHGIMLATGSISSTVERVLLVQPFSGLYVELEYFWFLKSCQSLLVTFKYGKSGARASTTKREDFPQLQRLHRITYGWRQPQRVALFSFPSEQGNVVVVVLIVTSNVNTPPRRERWRRLMRTATRRRRRPCIPNQHARWTAS